MSKKETSIVKVTAIPQTEIVKIEKANKPVIHEADSLIIRAADDETAAYEVLRKIKQRKTTIEDERKKITKPLNASLKQVNALFKNLSEPLSEADKIIRQKILAFRAKREEQAAKRQAKLLEKAETAEEEEDDEERAEELTEQAAKVVPLVGSSTTSKRWTFTVEEPSVVPRKYMMVDDRAIRAAVRNGVRDIPGVKIYQEEGLRVL